MSSVPQHTKREGRLKGVKVGIGPGEVDMLNGRVGGAHFAQQNKTVFLLNRDNVFQLIGVDYGGPAGARREAASNL